MSDQKDEKAKRRKAAAARAKAEAEARRAQITKKAEEAPKEIDGRGGLDPVRYDDWEIKGLTSDF
ncbi:MAG: DUF1674 domain-containing protein [Rhizobiales bacterium]|nr:DUF1674 domain-containing protein [Hyphomicrobiales bacterium]MBO6699990.1 DUF1674 domain-containing protein [Hyphomicrobiales bacterium]MBO6737845.1 DUF1674 domain-containing protein [Hyphomicrobiales bacterium]MBO6913098.1 DUF1674 domain-containing protein [Hyphomicrobiales bacterium]MBO6957078.1 DUF1674 domain-containing protein [Hyphomicrobiales bacterium]